MKDLNIESNERIKYRIKLNKINKSKKIFKHKNVFKNIFS